MTAFQADVVMTEKYRRRAFRNIYRGDGQGYMKASTGGRAFLLLILGMTLSWGNHHGFCCGNCDEEIKTRQDHSCCVSGNGGGIEDAESDSRSEGDCRCPKSCMTTCQPVSDELNPANATRESEKLSVEAIMACGLIAGGFAPPTSVSSGRQAFSYLPPNCPLFVPLRI